MKVTKALLIPCIWAGLVVLCAIVMYIATNGNSDKKFMNSLFVTAIFGAMSAGYLLPAFIAGVRNAPNYIIILLINILGGWSGVGWIASLIWAIIDRKEEQQAVVQQIIYRDTPLPLPQSHSQPKPPIV